MQTHSHALHAHARKRVYDPTYTTTLRQRFERDVVSRFRRLKSEIIKAVAVDDAFNLQQSGIIRVHRANFGFGTTAGKISEFMRWLTQQQEKGILEIQRGIGVTSSSGRAWTDVYIQSAYQKGIASAGKELRGMGVEVSDRWVDAAFNRPIHADRAGILFTRTFDDLEGITQAMDRQISRVLTQGIIEGRGPREIARQMADRVDKIGITRARVLARTEIIRAHHLATVNSYREAGVEGVEIEAEFSTADDELVCSECEALEGKTFTLEEAEGLIPVHPNCRCTTIAKVLSVDGISLE